MCFLLVHTLKMVLTSFTRVVCNLLDKPHMHYNLSTQLMELFFWASQFMQIDQFQKEKKRIGTWSAQAGTTCTERRSNRKRGFFLEWEKWGLDTKTATSRVRRLLCSHMAWTHVVRLELFDWLALLRIQWDFASLLPLNFWKALLPQPNCKGVPKEKENYNEAPNSFSCQHRRRLLPPVTADNEDLRAAMDLEKPHRTEALSGAPQWLGSLPWHVVGR